MSDDKKDFTRIEDLGEYIHELQEEDEVPEFGESLPDLPLEENSFGTSFSEEQAPDFDSPTEGPPSEEATDFGSTDFDSTQFDGNKTDFLSTEEPDFASSEEDPFSSSSEEPDFSSEESANEFNTEESPLNFDDEANSETTPSFEEPELFSEPMAEATFGPEPQMPLQSEPAPELTEPLPVAETLIEKTLLETTVAPEEAYKAPENFSDVKQFSESSSFTGMGVEGNPSFSVLIKNVRYIEDVADIINLLNELGLNDDEEQRRSRLMRGSLLVPRISEFAAVLLAHKLRRFDVDIQVGLSDEIHPPKHGEAPETGIVSKHNLYQNQSHHFHFDDTRLDISQIIVAATPTLEGHQVVRYLGVASEHKMIEGHMVEDETSDEIPRYYQELALKLKAHALKARSNAVVGLNYQLTPLPSEYGMSGAKYRLTCTGNLVWVNKL